VAGRAAIRALLMLSLALAAACNDDRPPSVDAAVDDMAASTPSMRDIGPSPYCRSTADCKKATSTCCNGFCVNLKEDPFNCGACGASCPAPANSCTPPTCANGACAIYDCPQGTADCDCRFDNGCEVNIAGDPLDCGACGHQCPAPSWTVAECVGAKCGWTCLDGHADCDRQAANGCEAIVAVDPGNCGACGNVCHSPPHAQASCAQGSCGFVCELGFGDCDQNAANGCESALDGDPANCGHCLNQCPVRANSSAGACVAARCVNQCLAGFGDCDGNAGNGCETDLRTDAGNCGACGNQCLNGQSCRASICN
jgi:hypothetical protein